MPVGGAPQATGRTGNATRWRCWDTWEWCYKQKIGGKINRKNTREGRRTHSLTTEWMWMRGQTLWYLNFVVLWLSFFVFLFENVWQPGLWWHHAPWEQRVSATSPLGLLYFAARQELAHHCQANAGWSSYAKTSWGILLSLWQQWKIVLIHKKIYYGAAQKKEWTNKHCLSNWMLEFVIPPESKADCEWLTGVLQSSFFWVLVLMFLGIEFE